jgi:glycosyltransferase involved in cell wall biosynthesis
MKDTLLFIPVKTENVQPFKNLLDSLKDYGYLSNKNFGVVVIDDGCKHQGVRDLCSNYPITYFRTKGIGKMAALNYGLKKTSSKYVAFTDHDNIIMKPSWLKILKSNLVSKDVGYVSGKVKLFKGRAEAQRRWEKKGALNKGNKKLILDKEFFNKFRFKGVPVNICTAGSNHIMPRKVIKEIGYHDERFGPGAFIDGAGGDLDITYKVLRKGYKVIYEPRAVIGHQHPTSFSLLRRKMYTYGISDTAIHLKFFLEFGDIRSLFQVPYRLYQNTSRFLRSYAGSYPLPPSVAFASILGNLMGPVKYFQLKLIVSNKHDKRKSTSV